MYQHNTYIMVNFQRDENERAREICCVHVMLRDPNFLIMVRVHLHWISEIKYSIADFLRIIILLKPFTLPSVKCVARSLVWPLPFLWFVTSIVLNSLQMFFRVCYLTWQRGSQTRSMSHLVNFLLDQISRPTTLSLRCGLFFISLNA